jgi:hypothetical protein
MKEYTVPVKIDGKDETMHMSILADISKINKRAIFMQILKLLTDNKK